MRSLKSSEQLFLMIVSAFFGGNSFAQEIQKGKLLYNNSLTAQNSVSEWRMEGLGNAVVDTTGMHLFSENESGHHVFWCPEEFPTRFIAEWEVKNEHPEAGLCIVFFASKGRTGQSIFDASIKVRNGIFKQYTKGDIDNYHISYYANTPTQKDREFSHLRKNPGFQKVHIGKPGISSDSEEWHRVTLEKNDDHIRMILDGAVIIDWIDDGILYGRVLGAGKIGFRQMKWTRFSYRNFSAWEAVNR
jgi:hypothetical protein